MNIQIKKNNNNIGNRRKNPIRNHFFFEIETATAEPFSYNFPTNSSCVNWNQYYTNCTQLGGNPFQGTISFDNIGMAWVAIFLVISLEGWTDIMYYVQDAHSFWDWIYFVLLIVVKWLIYVCLLCGVWMNVNIFGCWTTNVVVNGVQNVYVCFFLNK